MCICAILNFVCILLMVTFFVIIPDTVRAPQDGDFSYSVSADEKATITDYTGAGGAITINSTLGGYPTVAIGIMHSTAIPP